MARDQVWEQWLATLPAAQRQALEAGNPADELQLATIRALRGGKQRFGTPLGAALGGAGDIMDRIWEQKLRNRQRDMRPILGGQYGYPQKAPEMPIPKFPDPFGQEEPN